MGKCMELIKFINCVNKILKLEDASESLGRKYKIGKFKNKFTGTVGDIACLSFNGNNNYYW